MVDKSVILAHISIGESHIGNRDEAIDFYQKAKALDPQCSILLFAEKALEALG